MAVYQPHMVKRMLVSKVGQSSGGLSVREHFLLVFAGPREGMLSLANYPLSEPAVVSDDTVDQAYAMSSPSVLKTDGVIYCGLRLKEATQVFGVNTLQAGAHRKAHRLAGIPDFEHYVHNGPEILPAGSLLVTEAFDLAAKPPRWYAFRPQEEFLQNPQRVIFRDFVPNVRHDEAQRAAESDAGYWGCTVARRENSREEETPRWSHAVHTRNYIGRQADMMRRWDNFTANNSKIAAQKQAHMEDLRLLAHLGLLSLDTKATSEDYTYLGIRNPH